MDGIIEQPHNQNQNVSSCKSEVKRIYFTYNIDYELLENGKYLKIKKYHHKDDKRVISSEETFEKTELKLIKEIHENSNWEPCTGNSEKMAGDYSVYHFKGCYKVICKTKEKRNIAYYYKQGESK